jgi:hypothetical protein
MQWATFTAVAALLAQNVNAQGNMLRFACSQLVVERTDPLVNPGMKYTPHLHQIVGGNSFNVSMDPANDPAKLSTCTSCSFVQDKSNYWTAVMFFHHKNGSYIRVPQTGNGGPQGKLINKGGLDVYYIPSGKTTAFKKASLCVKHSEHRLTNCRVSACWLDPRPTRMTTKYRRATSATDVGHRPTRTPSSALSPAPAATPLPSPRIPSAR